MSLLKKKTVNPEKQKATAQQAELLAEQLADKPYGAIKSSITSSDEIVRTSISLPKSLLETLEDLTRYNKRQGVEPKTVSAIIRESLERYLLLIKK
ncbi:MAG: hypothetical protein AB2989_06065 [Candidatus Symbiodolus clandestinus]